jgi:hypothetical protein
MKLFFAVATYAGKARVRGQIRLTLKTPLLLFSCVVLQALP